MGNGRTARHFNRTRAQRAAGKKKNDRNKETSRPTRATRAFCTEAAVKTVHPWTTSRRRQLRFMDDAGAAIPPNQNHFLKNQYDGQHQHRRDARRILCCNVFFFVFPSAISASRETSKNGQARERRGHFFNGGLLLVMVMRETCPRHITTRRPLPSHDSHTHEIYREVAYNMLY